MSRTLTQLRNRALRLVREDAAALPEVFDAMTPEELRALRRDCHVLGGKTQHYLNQRPDLHIGRDRDE